MFNIPTAILTTLYYTLYMSQGIRSRKKVTKHDICHHEIWVGVVNTMDKERVFIDGMGQDMGYTSKKLEYISL